MKRKVLFVMNQEKFDISPLHGGTLRIDTSAELQKNLDSGWHIESIHPGGTVALEIKKTNQSVVSSWLIELGQNANTS